MTIDYNKTNGLSPTTRKPIEHNSRKRQTPLSFRPTYTLPTNRQAHMMGRNALKINEDKTEFIIFSAKHYTYDRMSMQIGSNTIQHSNNVKILGVTLDAHMTLEKQISNTCRTSYYADP